MIKFIAIIVALNSMNAMACRILPYEAMKELAEEELRLEVEFVKKVAITSDLIFVATVKNIKEKIEGDTSFYNVEVSLDQVLKGKYYKDLYWKEESNETITISCNVPILNTRINILESYKYLFYVRKGQILRASSFGQPIPHLSEADELKLINENMFKKQSQQGK